MGDISGVVHAVMWLQIKGLYYRKVAPPLSWLDWTSRPYFFLFFPSWSGGTLLLLAERNLARLLRTDLLHITLHTTTMLHILSTHSFLYAVLLYILNYTTLKVELGQHCERATHTNQANIWLVILPMEHHVDSSICIENYAFIYWSIWKIVPTSGRFGYQTLQVELTGLLDVVQETETRMVEMSALSHLMSTLVLQQSQQIEHLYEQVSCLYCIVIFHYIFLLIFSFVA